MVDQVSQALGGLARTIQTGLGGIAGQRIANAEFDLKTAQVGLQSKKDSFIIGKMRAEERERALLEQHLNSPKKISSMFAGADPIATPDIVNNIVPAYERVLGARADFDQGVFIKEDGSPITERDYNLNIGPLMAEYVAASDPVVELNKNDVRLGLQMEQAIEAGDTGKAQELRDKRVENQRRIDDHTANPLTLWQKQLSALTSASALFQNIADISGVNAKIKTLQSQISGERSRQTQLEIAGIRAGAKTGTISPESRLINEINAAPAGSARRELLTTALKKKVAPSGQVIEIDAESGDVTIGPSSVLEQRQSVKNEQKLSESETSVRNVIALADTVADLAGSDSTTIGIVGGIQRFVDTTVQQVRAASKVATRGLAEINGKTVPEQKLFDISMYDFGGFAKDAAKSARLKTTALRLAYLVARQQDPSGRLSDKDVQNALDQIGVKSGSIVQMTASLDQVKQNAIATFANEFRQGRECTGRSFRHNPRWSRGYFWEVG